MQTEKIATKITVLSVFVARSCLCIRELQHVLEINVPVPANNPAQRLITKKSLGYCIWGSRVFIWSILVKMPYHNRSMSHLSNLCDTKSRLRY